MSCRICKKEFEPVHDAIFIYDKLPFIVRSAEMKCFECTKKSIIERYDQHCRGLVRNNEGRMEIDWNFYKRVFAKGDQFEIGQVLSILVSLDVLTIKEGWDIVVPGVIKFTPFLINRYLNFSEERFAREYAEAMLAGTVVSWEVVKVL